MQFGGEIVNEVIEVLSNIVSRLLQALQLLRKRRMKIKMQLPPNPMEMVTLL